MMELPVTHFKRILCPVAESHVTNIGLHYAIALARSYGAKLFVLTCTNKSAASTSKTDSAFTISAKIIYRILKRLRRAANGQHKQMVFSEGK